MFCCDYCSQDPEENQPSTLLPSHVDAAAVVGNPKGSQELIFLVPAELVSSFFYFSQEVSIYLVQK
jgi:hypothetical protein